MQYFFRKIGVQRGLQITSVARYFRSIVKFREVRGSGSEISNFSQGQNSERIRLAYSLNCLNHLKHSSVYNIR